MNKKMAGLASAIFLFVFGFEVVSIQGSFIPSSQDLNAIGMVLFNVYVVPFELLSLIMVAGVVGMFYIAGRED
jgi:NADH:ubiquinone oxidoreductase subunit 6 (subunit J)